jgi:hypothetical protein
MQIILQRYFDNGSQTIGGLYLPDSIQRDCYILEDTYRPKKIMHKTRISAGLYPLKFRRYGRHYNRYKELYKDVNNERGMIQLMNVPNFTDILIHTGNTEKHTSGCLLTGNRYDTDLNDNFRLYDSIVAYRRVYLEIADLMEKCDVYLKIKDEGDVVTNLDIRGLEDMGSII